MKTKTVGTLLIAGLVVLSAMVVFAGTAAAFDFNVYKFEGYITDGFGGVEGVSVVIENTNTGKKWYDSTNSDGYYGTYYRYSSPLDIAGTYELRVDGNPVASQQLTRADFVIVAGQYSRCWLKRWSCEWNANLIPEFSTIALPAASILGLLFFFNHRKRRKED